MDVLDQTGWLTRGYFDLELPVESRHWDRLLDEGYRLHGAALAAVRRKEQGVAKALDGSLTSESCFSYYPDGPELRSLHTSGEAVEAVREVTRISDLTPFHCSYNYYVEGALLGLHRDKRPATITVTFGMTDNLGIMDMAPELAACTNDQLERLIEEEGIFPSGHGAMPVRFREFRGFAGHDVPHWRRRFDHSLGILGSLSYSSPSFRFPSSR